MIELAVLGLQIQCCIDLAKMVGLKLQILEVNWQKLTNNKQELCFNHMYTLYTRPYTFLD